MCELRGSRPVPAIERAEGPEECIWCGALRRYEIENAWCQAHPKSTPLNDEPHQWGEPDPGTYVVGQRWLIGPRERPMMVEVSRLHDDAEGEFVGKVTDARSGRVIDGGTSVEHPGEFVDPGAPRYHLPRPYGRYHVVRVDPSGTEYDVAAYDDLSVARGRAHSIARRYQSGAVVVWDEEEPEDGDLRWGDKE